MYIFKHTKSYGQNKQKTSISITLDAFRVLSIQTPFDLENSAN